MKLELSPLFVYIPLFIVNVYFEFQVYIFCNGRDMTKCQFLHHINDAKAIAIPRVTAELIKKIKTWKGQCLAAVAVALSLWVPLLIVYNLLMPFQK